MSTTEPDKGNAKLRRLKIGFQLRYLTCICPSTSRISIKYAPYLPYIAQHNNASDMVLLPYVMLNQVCT